MAWYFGTLWSLYAHLTGERMAQRRGKKNGEHSALFVRSFNDGRVIMMGCECGEVFGGEV